MDRSLDVVAIGHAIVDVLASATDELVARVGLTKGTMTLIDEDRAEELYGLLGTATEVSGGSAANTAAGLASLGATTAFVGKVRDDQLGGIFAHDIRAAGVHYDIPPAPGGPPTGRCLIMVTPDAERTMSTFLGAGDILGPSDIPEDQIARAKIVYVEGYLCGLVETEEALDRCVALTKAAGAKLAITLSDPFWVQLHGKELSALMDEADILLGNEEEARTICGVDSLDAALAELGRRCEVVTITRGAAGAVVIAGGERHDVGAGAVDKVVDTTGAGDLYAAGFLYGVTHGLRPEVSARLGALAAAEVISHVGARPLVSLRDLAVGEGLLPAVG